VEAKPLNLDAIKSRLVNAGYPHPEAGGLPARVREVSRDAQEARKQLRDNIIDDVWALLDEVERLRAQAEGPRAARKEELLGGPPHDSG